jgi:hypothetical protein
MGGSNVCLEGEKSRCKREITGMKCNFICKLFLRNVFKPLAQGNVQGSLDPRMHDDEKFNAVYSNNEFDL